MKIALKLAAMVGAMFLATSAMAAPVVNYSGTLLPPGVQPVPIVAPPGSVDINVSGSLANTYLDLWGGTACANSCAFNSVRKDGTATYLAGGELTSLALNWGSPDRLTTGGQERNYIEFFLGAISQGIVTGSQVSSASGLNGIGVIQVMISNIIYDSFVLHAAQNAFEHSFASRRFEIPEVPLPAGLVLLLSGLMGLGFVGRSRAKSA